MSKVNKDILTRANAAIEEGDFDGFLELCTEDTAWTFEGDTILKGKAAVRRWMEATYREPPKFNVHRMIAEGDFVVALGEITLKNEEGKATHYVYSDVWRFEEGRMAELHAFVAEAMAKDQESE